MERGHIPYPLLLNYGVAFPSWISEGIEDAVAHLRADFGVLRPLCE